MAATPQAQPPSASAAAGKDDTLTLMAISTLAYIVADILHEGLGHGVTAWLSGAHRLTISTVALQSDISTRWISANGTLANLLFGAILWFLLRRPWGYSPPMRYFLVLTMAGNLFSGTGYFLFSGVSNFGDWAAVVEGLAPAWIWRLELIVLGVASYYGAMLMVAAALKPFQWDSGATRRLRALCWTPYVTEAVLATLGGLVNPLGLFYVIASALPSTLGAKAGLLSLPMMMRGWSRGEVQPVGVIRRSAWWIGVGAIASLLFIFVLGRGITWTR